MLVVELCDVTTHKLRHQYQEAAKEVARSQKGESVSLVVSLLKHGYDQLSHTGFSPSKLFPCK